MIVEQVYADASRTRRVLGVLPLDNEGMPAPPTCGRVYATLPTEVTLPFGLHINADWLLNISRSGATGDRGQSLATGYRHHEITDILDGRRGSSSSGPARRTFNRTRQGQLSRSSGNHRRKDRRP